MNVFAQWRRLKSLPFSLLLRWSRFLRLSGAIPLADALKVVCRTTHGRAELPVLISSIQRHAVVRVNTSDVSCLEQVFVNQEYELPQNIAQVFDKPPRLIVDAGANIGMATLYFAHRFPKALIYAIEPEQSNFEILQRNCRGLDTLTLRKAALWNTRMRLEIADRSVDNWMFSVQPSVTNTNDVDAITVPDILEEIGASHIDILKIDIEGAERELFNDTCDLWLSKVKLIVIELHDRLKPGCAEAFYRQIARRQFIQEVRGENLFVLLQQ
jgi:FkbM family methyltransferase